jgi:hypothetical protein
MLQYISRTHHSSAAVLELDPQILRYQALLHICALKGHCTVVKYCTDEDSLVNLLLTSIHHSSHCKFTNYHSFNCLQSSSVLHIFASRCWWWAAQEYDLCEQSVLELLRMVMDTISKHGSRVSIECYMANAIKCNKRDLGMLQPGVSLLKPGFIFDLQTNVCFEKAISYVI